ncbi:MAG: NPCBM/NEW2 domain-containing protein [Verrucomicrobiota bacterium]
MRYELKPEYDRFVALAGIADNMLDHDSGRNLVMHCSVVFRVFIDGQLAAESPVMRISQEPWRFDVKISPGSRFINLVCMDAGSRSLLDQGNWVEAGFMLKNPSTTCRVRPLPYFARGKSVRSDSAGSARSAYQ